MLPCKASLKILQKAMLAKGSSTNFMSKGQAPLGRVHGKAHTTQEITFWEPQKLQGA